MESGTRTAGSHGAPWSPWDGIRPALVRNVLGFALFGLAFYGAYHFGMAFSDSVSSPFWFPDSVLLCVLLRTRMSWWWLLLLATLPIRLFTDVHPDTPGWFLGAVYINDCLKAVLGALLLKRFMADPIRFNSLRDFGVYCLVADCWCRCSARLAERQRVSDWAANFGDLWSNGCSATPWPTSS
jgi:hypothetical protein